MVVRSFHLNPNNSTFSGSLVLQYALNTNNIGLLFVTSYYTLYNAVNGACLASTFGSAIWRITMNTSCSGIFSAE